MTDSPEIPNIKGASIIQHQFKAGKSGNPHGRPKVEKRIVELCRDRSEDAVNTLYSIMMDEEAKVSSRIAAANSILDRAFGKAPMRVKIEEDEGAENRLAQKVQDALNNARTVLPEGTIGDTSAIVVNDAEYVEVEPVTVG